MSKGMKGRAVGGKGMKNLKGKVPPESVSKKPMSGVKPPMGVKAMKGREKKLEKVPM